MKCAVVSEVAPSIFTTNLYVNFISIHIPTLHTLFSFKPTDHEIAHQWSGNPHSWDSTYQHQRKPQRLLVKLLTNKFNTKERVLAVFTTGWVELHVFLAPTTGKQNRFWRFGFFLNYKVLVNFLAKEGFNLPYFKTQTSFKISFSHTQVFFFHWRIKMGNSTWKVKKSKKVARHIIIPSSTLLASCSSQKNKF